MNTLKNAAVFIARALICVWFLPEGLEKVVHYQDTAAYMASSNISPMLLPLVIATEVLCAVFILVGWKTSLFAFLLAGYTFLAVLFFHIPAADHVDKIVQMSELVNAGGFLVLSAYGAGDWSIDALRRPKRRLFK